MCYVASCAGVPVSTRDGKPRDLLQTALAVYSIPNAVGYVYLSLSGYKNILLF